MLCPLLLALTALITCIFIWNKYPSAVEQNPLSNAKAFQIAIYAIAASLWPLVLLTVATHEWKSDAFVSTSLMWIVTLWPIFVFAVDIFMLDRTPSQEIESAAKRKNEALSVSNIILSAVFTFGVLVSTIKKDQPRNARASRIILTALLIAILFVLPVFEIDYGDVLALAIASVVKVACVYSVGLFVVGVGVELA
tara:strand:- start:271 stop:855 length:585 start_codon:yes stop_codon:yes gene_type:complete